MIFGIGWHKTGTHSLQKALNILGFPGEHYPYWIYECYMKEDFNPDLKNNKSLTDFPVPLFYKRLELEYPKAKFILTTRDESQWLKSIENHLVLQDSPNKRFNGLSEREYYKRQGVPIDEIHVLAYGQTEFDKEIFLKRFKKHNKEVRHHFRDKNNFLEINISEKLSWDPLCGFLNRNIPSLPFPHEYKETDRTGVDKQHKEGR